MTQMMLFDTAADFQTTPVAAPVAPTPIASPESIAPPSSAAPTASENYERGVNHMGDLARLVLLRYDLVAARRARNAQRRAQEDARRFAK